MEIPILLITLGMLLLLGLFTEFVGKNTRLPRVTLLITLGLLLGSSGLSIIPTPVYAAFQPLTTIALAMIGFILGGKLTLSSLKNYGRYVLRISITVVIVVYLLILLGLKLLGFELPLAILLACVATATAPASTIDIIHELKTHSDFSKILLGIVAIDDVWSLILFSFSLLVVNFLTASTEIFAHDFLSAIWDFSGAVILGTVIGIPSAYLSGRIKPGELMLVEALGMIILVAGISLYLHVSYLLASMTLGFMVANLAKHHSRPFHAIENIESPFMIIFFILAGASLKTPSIYASSFIILAYILLRFAGKLIGAWLGSKISKVDPVKQRWMGVALLPQAGVAVGMTLVSAQSFPQFSSQLLPVAIASTIIFEIIGPIFTRKALIANS